MNIKLPFPVMKRLLVIGLFQADYFHTYTAAQAIQCRPHRLVEDFRLFPQPQRYDDRRRRQNVGPDRLSGAVGSAIELHGAGNACLISPLAAQRRDAGKEYADAHA